MIDDAEEINDLGTATTLEEHGDEAGTGDVEEDGSSQRREGEQDNVLDANANFELGGEEEDNIEVAHEEAHLAPEDKARLQEKLIPLEIVPGYENKKGVTSWNILLKNKMYKLDMASKLRTKQGFYTHSYYCRSNKRKDHRTGENLSTCNVRLTVISFHQLRTDTMQKPVLYGWRTGKHGIDRAVHSEMCGDHGVDRIKAEAHFWVGVHARTGQITPSMVYDRVCQRICRKFGKQARHWMLDKKTVTDKVSALRGKKRQKRPKQPVTFEEWVASLEVSFTTADGDEAFLRHYGPIDPADPDAGVYAFYISDHGATRLRTTKAGVWISDGTHRYALGFWTQLYCLASRTTTGRSQYSAYAFTNRKTTAFYRVFWQLVRDHVGEYVPNYLMTDLERGARTGFLDVYGEAPGAQGNCKLLLCYFHFSMALRRKAGELHLLDQIGTTAEGVFNEVYNLGRHLCYIPPEMTPRFWHVLLSSLRRGSVGMFTGPIEAWIKYLEDTYVGRVLNPADVAEGAEMSFSDPLWGCEQWSLVETVMEGLPVTSNGIEGLNSGFNTRCEHTGKTIWDVMSVIQEMESGSSAHWYGDNGSDSNTEASHKKGREAEAKRRRLVAVLVQWDRFGPQQKDWVHYLRMLQRATFTRLSERGSCFVD